MSQRRPTAASAGKAHVAALALQVAELRALIRSQNDQLSRQSALLSRLLQENDQLQRQAPARAS